MYQWLSIEEQQQAGRYKMADDKARFLVGRAMLRYLSGRYLARDGKSLQLELSAHGKPHLQEWDDKLSFNISHSGDWVMIAFTAGIPVGVDVEQMNRRPRFDFLNVAKHAFHPLEIAAIDAAPEEQKKHVFYDIWTCKEAVIKAIGVGLYGGLHQCSVLPLPKRDQDSIITCEARGSSMHEITVKKLMIDALHVGALAVQGCLPGAQLNEWGLPDSGWPI